jgi:hypothetical protein
MIRVILANIIFIFCAVTIAQAPGKIAHSVTTAPHIVRH